ncbi:hypothetical protein A9P82_13035 [Arachidicoccus ginsenosidimutans]|uniref:hypothetical protein n=1 Tax=Arachidicoccus sp. BS20 TaxID=1850526 RepID=UPI0007F06243|nr:hypothetical protein [Arachidicoccus sp. BS20]ANI90127.1 hypothetical protein A9P82_13035 [Arachidicoccus sp. BS20]
MSILSQHTEEKVIAVLAECIILFEKLYYLHMTAQDAFDARTAENLLKGIVESNGFRVVHRQGKNSKPYQPAD